MVVRVKWFKKWLVVVGLRTISSQLLLQKNLHHEHFVSQTQANNQPLELLQNLFLFQ